MNKPYFDSPTQVMFHDYDNPGHWICGIAYKDEVICACCGGVFEIDEICKMSEGYVDQAIYPYDSWVTLDEEIFGGECPNGLTIVEKNDEERVMEVSFLESEEYEQYSFDLEEAEEVQAKSAEI